MNEGHLITALFDCANGNVPFNLGTHRAFLHGQYWYPLRAVVNHAKRLAEEDELTTDRALIAALDLGFWIRSKEVRFETMQPMTLTAEEVIREVHELSIVIERLTRQ